MALGERGAPGSAGFQPAASGILPDEWSTETRASARPL